MPLYVFKCHKCGFEREELKKFDDTTIPSCIYCKNQMMERVFTPVTAILHGPGWTKGDYQKLRDRSKEQGKKFFKRHENLQDMAQKSVEDKPTL